MKGKELLVSASIPLAPPPKSTTQHQQQQNSWQWRLTLIEEQRYQIQRRSGKYERRQREEKEVEDEEATDTKVDLSVELRGLSTVSSLPSSGPFGGFLLQYKSFTLVAKNTRFTLVSKMIDSSSTLSLQGIPSSLTRLRWNFLIPVISEFQLCSTFLFLFFLGGVKKIAKVKASHVLGQDGYYNFAIVLSTESLVHETVMAPLGSIFPRLFLSLPGGFGGGGGGDGGGGYLKSIDAIFDDPVSTDVVFIWQDKVMEMFTGDSDRDCDSDIDGGGDRDERRKQISVTLSKLYAHQAVLHQYPYFRRKLPLLSSSSCVMMPRKLLMKDFSLPVFRVILR